MLPRLKPDVVTVDVNMPRMDGFEVTRRIMESHPLPVVIVSASGSRRRWRRRSGRWRRGRSRSSASRRGRASAAR